MATEMKKWVKKWFFFLPVCFWPQKQPPICPFLTSKVVQDDLSDKNNPFSTSNRPFSASKTTSSGPGQPQVVQVVRFRPQIVRFWPRIVRFRPLIVHFRPLIVRFWPLTASNCPFSTSKWSRTTSRTSAQDDLNRVLGKLKESEQPQGVRTTSDLLSGLKNQGMTLIWG